MGCVHHSLASNTAGVGLFACRCSLFLTAGSQEVRDQAHDAQNIPDSAHNILQPQPGFRSFQILAQAFLRADPGDVPAFEYCLDILAAASGQYGQFFASVYLVYTNISKVLIFCQAETGIRVDDINQMTGITDIGEYLKQGSNELQIKLVASLQNRDPATIRRTTYGLTEVSLIPYFKTKL